VDFPRGHILSLHQGYAIVSVVSGAACARCASGKGCGAGLIAVADRPREIKVPLADGLPLKAGDPVALAIPPADLLRGAIYAYGLPLAGMVFALASARLLQGPLTDLVAVLVAAGGLAVAWTGSRLSLQRPQCFLRFQPVIITRNDEAM
jgi:sigma-E factor negative regulatory protein RseC